MTISSDLPRVLRLGILALLIAAAPGLLKAETVTITEGLSVGSEPTAAVVPEKDNPNSASVIVSRTGQDPLFVRLKAPSGTAVIGTGNDYVLATGNIPRTLIAPGVGGVIDLSFAQGETVKIIHVVPLHDALIEGREIVTLEIMTDPGTLGNSTPYITGAPPSAQVTIADNDLAVTMEVPDPVADEDSNLFGFVNDLYIRRRGVMRSVFSQAVPFDRNLAVQLAGTAAVGSDYAVKFRICGNDNLAYAPLGVSAGTADSSHIGYDAINVPSTGMGYQIVAHRIGQTVIFVQGTGSLASGNTIQFQNHGTVYTTQNAFNGSSAGPVQLVISPALTANLTNGLAITPLTGVPMGQTVSMAVSNVYPAGATTVAIANGSGGIYRGDVFALGTDQSILYVAEGQVTAAQGDLTFHRYIGAGSGAGLATAVSATTEVVTMLSPTLVSGAFNVLVPEESTRMEVSIEPIADGVVEGRETVTMTLIASEDYLITNPTVGQVTIADRDSVANITLQTNAGKPNSTGSFTLTLDRPFSIPITVPYMVTGSAVPGPNATAATADYVALTLGATSAPYTGSVTVPAGSTAVSIPVVPGQTGTVGTTTVVVSLTGSLDYRLQGSSGSGTNPSSTMSISASVGAVSIAATDASALESASPSAATTGTARVSVVPTVGATLASNLSVAVRISGTADYPGRFTLQSGGGNLSLTSAGAGVYTAAVTIPAASNFVDITVVPGNNFIADGSETVIIEVQTSQGYTLASAAPAVVTILDDEPTISVAVRPNANGAPSKPSTPWFFDISYSGTALNQAVTVNYALSGTAVLGTDYSASSSITIPSGSSSAPVTIAPLPTPDDASKTVTITLSSSTEYTLGVDTATMTINPATTTSGTKPTPGTINTGGSGGCGLGSGIATLAGLGLLAFRLSLIRRRRRD